MVVTYRHRFGAGTPPPEVGKLFITSAKDPDDIDFISRSALNAVPFDIVHLARYLHVLLTVLFYLNSHFSSNTPNCLGVSRQIRQQTTLTRHCDYRLLYRILL